MKLQVKSNFSFSKLAKEMPNILKKYSEGAGKGAASGIKNALEKGSYDRLKDSTTDIRRRGQSPSARFMKTNSKKPLIHTGRLRDSIRQGKDGVKMLEYGVDQNDGFKVASSVFSRKFHTVVTTVAPRPFIDKGLEVESPESKKALEDLSKNIEKAIRK